MSHFAIRASNLSKRFRIVKKQKYKMLSERLQSRIKNGVKNIFKFEAQRQKPSEDNFIWALDDVSFEIKSGQSMGIIGANGAGKTTLLKILARVTAPTQGQVKMRGRVGSLLEVGTGFHSELTGRENVYLNGAILGMQKKEIDRKFEQIVDFSGVEEFIDTPVKRFSSGMRMRLAFSVAAHLEPEILLVDEVLAVGDIAFQNKSLAKMEKVTLEGRTILFVSHNLAAVKSLCAQSIYLEHGKLSYIGDTETAVQMYLQSNETASQTEAEIQAWKRAQILSLRTCNQDGSSRNTFPHNQPIYIRIKANFRSVSFKQHLTLRVHTSNLELLFASNDFEPSGNSLIPASGGVCEFQVEIPAGLFTPGKYFLGAHISRQVSNRIRALDKVDHTAEFEVYDNGSLLSQLNIAWQGSVHPPLSWKRLEDSKNGK
jgi:lipopolysaccharide transport system ATP-binding protein